jgi:hypothetical protein
LHVLERGLSDADDLAILHAIWVAEITPARDQRHRDLLTAVLPDWHRQAEFGPQARWLWRTLRAAELAGLYPGQVLREAIAQRSMADAEIIAAVIDSRIRQRAQNLIPGSRSPGQLMSRASTTRTGRPTQSRSRSSWTNARNGSASTPPSSTRRGRSPRSGQSLTIRAAGLAGSSAPARSAPTVSLAHYVPEISRDGLDGGSRVAIASGACRPHGTGLSLDSSDELVLAH